MQTVKKLVYAFIFQEGDDNVLMCSYLTYHIWKGTFEVDILTSPAANQAGAFLQSAVNFKLGLPTALPNLGGNLGHGLGTFITYK